LPTFLRTLLAQLRDKTPLPSASTSTITLMLLEQRHIHRPANGTIQLRITSQYVRAARNAAHNFVASAWVSAPIRTRAAPM